MTSAPNGVPPAPAAGSPTLLTAAYMTMKATNSSTAQPSARSQRSGPGAGKRREPMSSPATDNETSVCVMKQVPQNRAEPWRVRARVQVKNTFRRGRLPGPPAASRGPSPACADGRRS